MNQEQTMYYIGGLFDGEGSCGVYKCYGNGMGSPQLSCTINMTTMDGLLATYRSRVMPNASESGILPALTCRGERCDSVLRLYGQGVVLWVG